MDDWNSRWRLGTHGWTRAITYWLVALLGCAESVGAAGPAETGAALFEWRPFLAPFHSVVLHFPIGFFTMACILEIYRIFRPSKELRNVTVLVLWLSLLSGVVSAVFGLMRAGGGGYDATAVNLHRVYGLAVPVATILTLAFQKVAYRDEARLGWTGLYRLALGGTLVLIVVAGHLGGNLTHGARYLTENAPKFVRELLEPDAASEEAMAKLDVLDQRERQYLEKVEPLLQAKCYKCHGPEKQKGEYRLDDPVVALKGGESGKTAIKPRDAIGSYLVQLILLPPDHDDVMPPEGKEPLTIEDMAVLLDWIRNGAVFPASAVTGASIVN